MGVKLKIKLRKPLLMVQIVSNPVLGKLSFRSKKGGPRIPMKLMIAICAVELQEAYGGKPFPRNTLKYHVASRWGKRAKDDVSSAISRMAKAGEFLEFVSD
jgi:hypothetical protein